MTQTSASTPAPGDRGRVPTIANARPRSQGAERHPRNSAALSLLPRIVNYIRSSLWMVPFLTILIVLAIAPLLRWLDAWLDWRGSGLGLEGARALYQSVITLALSFMVFTFGSLLVAIQVASGQLTPRIIATTLLRDKVVKYSVGLFVFSLVFAIAALDRTETTVHQIVALLTAILGISCMAAFLYLIDYAARLLRPVSILARVADEGRAVIASVYPNQVGDAADVDETPPATLPGASRRIVHHGGPSEIVLAVDLDTLASEAQRANGVIEVVPQVGDFVATDEPLFVLYGSAVAIDDARLRKTIALGSERTMEQDPLFSFRIIVDIELKALSPAINDPTTAVLAIDQVHRLLRLVGQRQLRGESIEDAQGHTRLIYRTPNWEDFVHLSCNEIRSCGASNVQIARRLRAMLDNLIASLPAHRHPPLDQERQRLERMLESLYAIPEDLALARIPDSQGLGGSSGRRGSTSTRA
jgi:uncharacterized membrane protein